MKFFNLLEEKNSNDKKKKKKRSKLKVLKMKTKCNDSSWKDKKFIIISIDNYPFSPESYHQLLT